jgi:hypothetical protein
LVVIDLSELRHYFQIFSLCVLVALILAIVPLTKGALAENINPGVFPINSKPFGQPYSQWAVKSWQWTFSIHKEQDPSANDPAGQKCSVNQNDPHVWFLQGISSGSAVLNCNVPQGKAIFMSILSGECDYLSDKSLNTEADLTKCARSGIEGATMQVAVDGIVLKDIQTYWVESPIFSLTFHPDNIYGVPYIGTTQAKVVGYYLFLEPLSLGRHTIHISYNIMDNPTLGTYSAAVDETFNIQVKLFILLTL